MAAADLRDPTVELVTHRINEHRRIVPIEPVIRLRLFTEAGAERGTDLSREQALRLIKQLSHALLRDAEVASGRAGASEVAG